MGGLDRLISWNVGMVNHVWIIVFYSIDDLGRVLDSLVVSQGSNLEVIWVLIDRPAALSLLPGDDEHRSKLCGRDELVVREAVASGLETKKKD